MAYRLIDRHKQIPNGLHFYQPQTKWRSRPWSSFNGIVEALISHRQANPWLGLPTGRREVEAEVDAFNANICATMGWGDYITSAEGAAVAPFQSGPSRLPSLLGTLANVAVGAEANVEWLADGAEAVPAELSNQRAGICVLCPLNGKGDLTRYFTVPAAAAIRKAYELRRDWKLSTVHDDQLGVCEACSCPMKLKVHFPIQIVRDHIRPQAKADLHPKCWILNEP